MLGGVLLEHENYPSQQGGGANLLHKSIGTRGWAHLNCTTGRGWPIVCWAGQ